MSIVLYGISKIMKDERLLELKATLLELLHLLLEESSYQSFTLFQNISQDIRLATVLDALLDFWVKVKNILMCVLMFIDLT